MTTEHLPTTITTTGDELEARGLLDRAASYASASASPNTLRAYRAACADFARFCDRHDAQALPADPRTVAAYLAEQADAGRATSTIAQRLAGIRWAHKRAGHDTPTTHPAVEAVWAGIRRTQGTAPAPKRALLIEDVRRIVRGLDRSTAQGCRDAALLLVGFAGGFRRSELVGLRASDLSWHGAGVVITLRRSKTDQDGAGRIVEVARGRRADTCPVRALRAWIDLAGVEGDAPVFRSVNRHGHVGGAITGRGVAVVIKRLVAVVGLDADDFAGHSLRRGLVTSAARAGASDATIMRTTGHKSRAMLDRYRQAAALFDDCAADGLL